MTYFDYWASKPMETQYRHYAAKHGGVPMTVSLSMHVKKLNDGHCYTLGGWSLWKDPLRPHGRLAIYPAKPSTPSTAGVV